MGKKQFYNYLDNPDKELLQEADDLQLAAILKECEDLEAPDPGMDYWNNFNANLQTKLDALPQKKPFWSRFALPIWATVAAVLLAAFLFMGRQDTTPLPAAPGFSTLAQSETDVDMEFDTFDNDTLDLLLEFYESDSEEEEESYELAENDYDLLHQVFDSQPGQSLDELIEEEISAEDLKALWEVEG